MRKFPRSLLMALNEGRLLPFVGAGVPRSVRDEAGLQVFPTWLELLQRAGVRLLDEHHVEAAHEVQMCLGRTPPNYLGAAQIARDALVGRLWRDFMLEQFNPRIDRIDRRTLGLAEAIWALGSPLVITTNYDRVMEWTCPRATDCESWPTNAPAEHARALEGSSDKPAVWHLHGTIQLLDQVILTTSDYKLLYPDPKMAEQLNSALLTLRNFLAIKTFIFFGFGFNDEQFLQAVLSVVEAFRGNVGPHYAFVHKDEIPRLAPRAKDLCLQLIPIDAYGPPFTAMVRELGQARGRALPPITQPPLSADREEPSDSPGSIHLGVVLGGGTVSTSDWVTGGQRAPGPAAAHLATLLQ